MSWMRSYGDGRSLAARGAALFDCLLLLGRDQAAGLFLDLLMDFLDLLGLLLLRERCVGANFGDLRLRVQFD